MTGIYYNEFDPFAAAWLRELMNEDLIPRGDVDERDINLVQASDLRGYTQVHLFAGIGGWPYALRLAGWPDDEPVWTGSCPCQPFSAAGKRQGIADKRHLWPEFHRLVAECAPSTILGEQVASKDGRLWLAGVRADLEALGYAVGAADLCAAGIGAPHIRQRLYWMADSNQGQRRWFADRQEREFNRQATGRQQSDGELESSGGDCGVADAECDAREQGWPASEHREGASTPPAGPCAEPGRRGMLRGLALPNGGLPSDLDLQRSGQHGQRPQDRLPRLGSSGTFGGWGDTWLACADGKARRVEPGIFPLAHGVPNRMGTLRGSGNAINPQAACEFISAFIECRA